MHEARVFICSLYCTSYTSYQPNSIYLSIVKQPFYSICGLWLSYDSK
jgi:hypothetical protein